SCHIRVADIPLSASERILRQVNDAVRERFRIHHTTIQLEHVECEVAQGCAPPAPDEHLRTH
ncbi:MAG: cation diffusion facilitator family transporter, partial [Terriglobales bacterium]